MAKRTEIIPIVEVLAEETARASAIDAPYVPSDTAYTSERYAFVNSLFERIGSVLVDAAESANPLAGLLQQGQEYGRTFELIHINPALRVAFDPFNAHGEHSYDAVYQPDVIATYHPLNRGNGHGDQYPLTVPMDDIKKALTSAGELYDFEAGCVQSLYSGKTADDKLYIQRAFAEPIAQGKTVTFNVATKPSTKADFEDFIAALRTYILNMQELGADYNSYALYDASKQSYTASPQSNLVCIVRNDILANLSVKLLAGAFNVAETDVPTRVFGVKSLGDENTLALLFDRRYLRAVERTLEFSSDLTKRARQLQMQLFVDGSYSVAPAFNAIAFRVGTPNSAESAAFDAVIPATWDATGSIDNMITLTDVGNEFVTATWAATDSQGNAIDGLVLVTTTAGNNSNLNISFSDTAKADAFKATGLKIAVTLAFTSTLKGTVSTASGEIVMA